jgi:hypothetical protein
VLRPIHPDRLGEADAYVERGFDHLIVDFHNATDDFSPLKELVAWRDSRNEGKDGNGRRQSAPQPRQALRILSEGVVVFPVSSSARSLSRTGAKTLLRNSAHRA